MPKPPTRSGESKPSPRSDNPKPKAKPRKRPNRILFGVEVEGGRVHLEAFAPAKLIHVLAMLLGCAFIAAVIKLLPEWWPAIQTAMAVMASLVARWK